MAPVQQKLALYGGGFAGRLTPRDDVTADETARGTHHNHEGLNGGWVLRLFRAPLSAPLDLASRQGPLQALLASDPSLALQPVEGPHEGAAGGITQVAVLQPLLPGQVPGPPIQVAGGGAAAAEPEWTRTVWERARRWTVPPL